MESKEVVMEDRDTETVTKDDIGELDLPDEEIAAEEDEEEYDDEDENCEDDDDDDGIPEVLQE